MKRHKIIAWIEAVLLLCGCAKEDLRPNALIPEERQEMAIAVTLTAQQPGFSSLPTRSSSLDPQEGEYTLGFTEAENQVNTLTLIMMQVNNDGTETFEGSQTLATPMPIDGTYQLTYNMTGYSGDKHFYLAANLRQEHLNSFTRPHYIFNAGEEDSFALARPYILIGIVVALVTLAFCFIRLPEIKTEVIREAFPGGAEPKGEGVVVPLYKRPSFVRAVIAQFCYCAAQTGIFSFFINYVTEMDPQISNVRASQFLAFGGMALFMLGRLSGSFTMRWLKPSKLLFLYALASIVCMALVMASAGRISLYALYITFFFMSIMFPTIFALGLEGMGGQTKKASSYLVMSVAGGAFSPMLMGYIGEDNMATGFIVPLLAFGYILYFAWRFKAPAGK